MVGNSQIIRQVCRQRERYCESGERILLEAGLKNSALAREPPQVKTAKVQKQETRHRGREAFAQGGNVALNSPVFHVLSRPNGASLEAGATQTRDC